MADALNAAEIAAVLLRLEDGTDADLIERVRALRILIQSNGAALLLDGHAALVSASEADGAHLTGIEAFKSAAPSLKPARIAGCGGLATRHDAMLAAESGADYVMFGEPDPDGHRPGFEAVRERVAWWADVFTIPASAMRRRWTKSRRSRAPVPISSRSVPSCGSARAARQRPLPPSRSASQFRRRPNDAPAVHLRCGDGGPARGERRVCASPLQITPPPARPPASIPDKPQKPKVAKPPLKKSIAAPAPPKSAPPKSVPITSTPSAFAPETVPAAPFAAPEKLPTSQQAALQPQPAPGAQGDVAFGAFQRGYYVEAFKEASRRASEQGDPVAMTLIGELYANGYGVVKDEKKALAWFSLAADRGDRQAIFALAMFRFAGRGGAQDQAEAAALLDKAAKLGHVAAAYNLALLHLEGQQMRQDIARAAELLRGAADAGSPEAQYALATLYKEGNGIAKDPVAAAKLLGAAARSGNDAAQVEYAIALFNGTGIAKDENGAIVLFRKAALKGNAVAQNRLARILATGRGVAADPVAATKWHTIAKAGGASDIWLENFMQTIKPAERAAGENQARLWLAHAKPNT